MKIIAGARLYVVLDNSFLESLLGIDVGESSLAWAPCCGEWIPCNRFSNDALKFFRFVDAEAVSSFLSYFRGFQIPTGADTGLGPASYVERTNVITDNVVSFFSDIRSRKSFAMFAYRKMIPGSHVALVLKRAYVLEPADFEW